MSLVPCLLFAQTVDDDSLLTAGKPNLAFDAHGVVPCKNASETYWDNVPAECHIDWRRRRERPLIDFFKDLSNYFNTFDTTYVARNRYDFRAMAVNDNFFQIYRVVGRNSISGERQMLTFAPDHNIKVGIRAGWRWLLLAYTVGVVPNSNHKSSEFNFSIYNSRFGVDVNYQQNGGPFHLRRIRGVEGVSERVVKGIDVDGISTQTMALDFYYVLNYRHFANPSAHNANSVQLRSAGSWVVGANYDYQQFNFSPERAEVAIRDVYCQQSHLSGGSALDGTASDGVEDGLPVLNEALRVREINYHRIGFSVGYGYNWVPAPGWLLSLSAAPSIGFKKQVGENISRQMLVDNFRNFHVDAIFRGAVVYNRQRWYAGVSAVSYLYDYRHRDFDLNNNVTYIKAYVGVQFFRRKSFRLSTDRSIW